MNQALFKIEKMTLKKLKNDHYVIVDDSEIKEGDWFLPISGIGWELNKPRQADSSGGYSNGHCKKITHSTQPLEQGYGCEIKEGLMLRNVGKELCYDLIKPLSLSEVKELIGEVDVEKKAREIVINNNPFGAENFSVSTFNGLVKDITKALEDKEKKWTDEDVIRIVEKSRETGLTAEYLMMTFQPKTEWEVEFVDGKMKLKK